MRVARLCYVGDMKREQLDIAAWRDLVAEAEQAALAHGAPRAEIGVRQAAHGQRHALAARGVPGSTGGAEIGAALRRANDYALPMTLGVGLARMVLRRALR